MEKILLYEDTWTDEVINNTNEYSQDVDIPPNIDKKTKTIEYKISCTVVDLSTGTNNGNEIDVNHNAVTQITLYTLPYLLNPTIWSELKKLAQQPQPWKTYLKCNLMAEIPCQQNVLQPHQNFCKAMSTPLAYRKPRN